MSRSVQGSSYAPSANQLIAPLAVVLVLGCASPAFAEVTIVRVEEDWELVVREPDAAADAPQITSVMSPLEHVEGIHMTFELNHQTLPSFTAGGMQLQVWDFEDQVSNNKFPQNGELNTAGETIRWTQQMRLSGSNLTFEITGGSSETWGAFGGQGYLKSTVATDLDSLNGYRHECSVTHTGIGFAANRVEKLVLKEIRWYTASGLLAQDTTPKVVHQHEGDGDD